MAKSPATPGLSACILKKKCHGGLGQQKKDSAPQFVCQALAKVLQHQAGVLHRRLLTLVSDDTQKGFERVQYSGCLLQAS